MTNGGTHKPGQSKETKPKQSSSGKPKDGEQVKKS
ncbi:hypothetical protein Mal52_13510 [Symmachiella dynata]|uniref:Uncharacterized protein n=1 Tax=Symmachiella dynata TaxID=2527995 RepID=A0A517ZK53_9PLAN|nr:hypothetical protein Mal52_13510 [Symmachiella dynata]